MKPVPPARPKRGDDPAAPIANADVAAIFDEIADLLELQAASIFRIRAYRNAARMLGDLGRSVQGMVAQGEDLDALPDIGADLAAKITDIVNTGSCALLAQLRAQVPPGVVELLHIPGIGPGRARALQQALGIRTFEDVQRSLADGRLGKGPASAPRPSSASASRLLANRRTGASGSRWPSRWLRRGLRASWRNLACPKPRLPAACGGAATPWAISTWSSHAAVQEHSAVGRDRRAGTGPEGRGLSAPRHRTAAQHPRAVGRHRQPHRRD